MAAKNLRTPRSSKPEMLGGAHEGASKFANELATWHPPVVSADKEIGSEKVLLDARGRDMIRNDGYAAGATAVWQDSVVGGQFRLNAAPDYEMLGLTEEWAEEFQNFVEKKFSLWAESSRNWPDATRTLNFTGLVRLAIASFLYTGEILATAEWARKSTRPYRTMIQLIDPDRLSNPDGVGDSRTMKRGVEKDQYGAPIAYHIRRAHPSEYNDNARYEFRRVPAFQPWGRKTVIHIFEPLRIDQSRGVAAMVSVLKQMKMTKKYQDIVLQNAVVNATYAATIESELPSEAVYEMLGAGNSNTDAFIANYLSQISTYASSAKNLHIDGAKIPHLFPGTKLKMQNAASPGGVGSNFEESLLRHIAASLGLSYEQFSRDYTKTNYSSARASMAETWKHMNAKKAMVADRFANAVYMLWLEEELSKGEVPLPPGAPNFWDGLNAEAYSKCTWIGASRGQIDEKKETEAAVMRIERGLSTYERECAQLGQDFREVFAQRAREKKLMDSYGLEFGEPKPATAGQSGSTDNGNDDDQGSDSEAT